MKKKVSSPKVSVRSVVGTWRSSKSPPPRAMSPQCQSHKPFLESQHKKKGSMVIPKKQSIGKLYASKLKEGEKGKTLIESNSTMHFSHIATEEFKRSADGGATTQRVSLDLRTKDIPPKVPVSFSKLYRGIRLASSNVSSPKGLGRKENYIPDSRFIHKFDPRKQPEKKTAPLKILKSRKTSGAASSLAMRYPSPRLNSFEVHKADFSEVKSIDTTEAKLQRVGEKRTSDASEKPKIPSNDFLKSLLSSSKQKERSASQKASPANKKNSIHEGLASGKVTPSLHLREHKPIIIAQKEDLTHPRFNPSYKELMQKFLKKLPKYEPNTIVRPPRPNKIDKAQEELLKLIHEQRKRLGENPPTGVDFYNI